MTCWLCRRREHGVPSRCFCARSQRPSTSPSGQALPCTPGKIRALRDCVPFAQSAPKLDCELASAPGFCLFLSYVQIPRQTGPDPVSQRPQSYTTPRASGWSPLPRDRLPSASVSGEHLLLLSLSMPAGLVMPSLFLGSLLQHTSARVCQVQF